MKYKIVIIGIIIIVIVIIILLNQTKSNELILKEQLLQLGVDYYENTYYPNIVANNIDKTYLKNYETIGIKVSLEEIIKNNKKDLSQVFENNITKEVCDFEKSEVLIFPKETFKKESYEIKITLECGFN